MHFLHSNMIVRATNILHKATCGRHKHVPTILQTNVNFQTISRSKSAGNPFIPTSKMYKRKFMKKKEFDSSPYLLLGIPIVTFGLGTWQIFRLRQKLQLIDILSTRTTRKPVELPEILDELQSMEYCPVKVRGKFLHDKEFLVGPRSFMTNQSKGLVSFGDTETGYLVITPFELEDRNVTILVNRGWIPRAVKNPSKRQAGQVEDTVELVGLVKFGETRPIFSPKNKPQQDIWIYKDISTMAKIADTEPVYLEAVASSTIPDGPIGGQTKVNVRNDHLSYILTWYGLCIGTLYVWFKTYRIPRV